MSYTKLTDFAAKDALLSGNPSKLLRGTEIDAEFAALEATDALNAKTGTGVSFSSITDTGNLTFTGTGNRIRGDFSNATIANRTMFQTSTVNGLTSVSAIPNGSNTAANFSVYSNNGALDAARGQLAILSGEVRVSSDAVGAGGYYPLTFHTGGSERMRIDTSGNVTVATQTAGDNSTKVATTAYVDASGVAASETVAGKIEIATAAEVQSGTDTVRAITPSGLRSGLNASGSAGIYAVRAWCKFNGTLGGTNAPAGGGNVTNVVTNSTGNYTINFSSAMPDLHFAVSAVASGASATYEMARTTSSVTIQVVNTAWSAANSVIVSVQVSR